MSKRVEVLILLGLALLCGLASWHFLDHDVIPAVKYGADGPNGVVIDGSGWLKIIAAALGTGGFSIASVVTIWKNFSQLLPEGNPLKRFSSPLIDTAQLGIYLQAYSAAKTKAEKDQIRVAARTANDSLFEELFPVDLGGA